jgi:hypothetical protein
VAVVASSAAPAAPARTPDRIRAVLNSLVHERQALRDAGDDAAGPLEANRLAIVYWQHELSRRLIEAAIG